MSENPTDELADLREQTERGDRISESDEKTTFSDRVQEELERIESGETHKNITAHDKNMAAFFRAIESDPELQEDVIESFAEAAGQPTPDRTSRAVLFRLALREGFDSVTPELLEAAEEGVRESRKEELRL